LIDVLFFIAVYVDISRKMNDRIPTITLSANSDLHSKYTIVVVLQAHEVPE
jgi:hypothetical protein